VRFFPRGPSSLGTPKAIGDHPTIMNYPLYFFCNDLLFFLFSIFFLSNLFYVFGGPLKTNPNPPLLRTELRFGATFRLFLSFLIIKNKTTWNRINLIDWFDILRPFSVFSKICRVVLKQMFRFLKLLQKIFLLRLILGELVFFF
jgi:hypothetical protein